MEENRNNPTKFWNTVKTILPDQKATTKISMNDHNGDPIPEMNLPNYVNQFFASIGTQLSADNPFKPEQYTFRDDRFPEQFQLQLVTEEQVLNEIKRLKNSKSSAIPNVSTKICKDAFTVLITQLTHTINLSIRHEKFPDAWKNA